MKSKLEKSLAVEGYAEFLQALKTRIQQAQVRAALSVNRELVVLYWHIGREILQKQQAQGWGAKVIDRLAKDLRREFPDMKGFSPRNLKYMRAFGESYADEQFVQQVAAQIPWFHHCVLLDKVKDPTEREWYIRQTFENGWSRNVLVHQIQTGLFERQGKAVTNFARTLPSPQSDLAQQLLKDPYNFDFLSMGQEFHERDVERSLLVNIRDFLLELGVGFAFVGSQYHLEVGGEDFYLDLLFYHLKLRCYMVIDLKIGEFKPEDSGKMNFYLAVVDDVLRHEQDAPSIGLILCQTQNRLISEYALRDMNKPIGVSAYELTRSLPEELKGSLPTIEEIEAELSGKIEEARE
jgi:predicted nuclease of restriction endonuclease-like (RecB) superfamily